MATLIIVESPAKAKTIKGLLGQELYSKKRLWVMFEICPAVSLALIWRTTSNPATSPYAAKDPCLRNCGKRLKRRIASYWPLTLIGKGSHRLAFGGGAKHPRRQVPHRLS